MKVREAQLNDIDSIEQISSGLGYERPPLLVAQDRLLAVINSTSDKIWVAESDGEIIGWLHAFEALRVASPSFVEIAGIAVLSESRKKGAGRALILHVQSRAYENGLALKVRCNAMREETHEFYKSLGFVKIKGQHVFEAT